ncbi:MAG: thioredoxin domain-containing protein [Elusimicrobiota bacterium]
MMRKSVLLAALLPLLFACRAAALDKQALADHLRESYNFPATVNIELTDPKDSEIPGFQILAMSMSRGSQSQTQELYLSKDGRYYILGGFKDLSVHPDQERIKKMDISGAPSRGDKKAPVIVVEYTDFQCPFCKKGYDIMQDRIMKEFEGKVRWVYKSFPLTRIHPWAEPAAVGVECAKLQGEDKFWRLHDLIFDAQKEIRMANLDEKLEGFAGESKLDMEKFNACYDARKTKSMVDRDMAEAQELGITGAPAFLVNGHLVSGADYQGLKQTIEEALQGKHGKI